jgi:ubiquinol-cytochrome c reductase cytochrome c1 subunit
MMRTLAAFTCTALLALGAALALAQEETPPPYLSWSFDGIFGTYDRGALQRGFQIYSEICSNCHSMNLLHYRDLTALGYNEDEIKAIAAQKQVTAGPNDQGEMFQRPGRPYDKFVAPFANEQQARMANNGALPPDMSLLAKAHEGGPSFIYGILTGYKNAPKGFKLLPGMNYDEYFPGHQIAMPQPLQDNSVTFADGTHATLDEEARDVATFLAWCAEPKMEDRKRTGAKVMLFLLAMTGVLYGTKRKIWSDVH